MQRVTNETRGKLLGDQVREARTFLTRLKGLLGTRAMPVGQGLHIVPCNSIHTFFMSLSIDAVFLDRSHRVVKVCPAMAPWRVSGVYLSAHSVLELPAGVALASGTVVGDQLRFEAR
ncbi:MAG: DUF192 domain-containing protein [Myxococcaceae bacterium]|nr:DUF192 domain-containing protein [Myxococcaceae bacterium]